MDTISHLNFSLPIKLTLSILALWQDAARRQQHLERVDEIEKTLKRKQKMLRGILDLRSKVDSGQQAADQLQADQQVDSTLAPQPGLSALATRLFSSQSFTLITFAQAKLDRQQEVEKELAELESELQALRLHLAGDSQPETEGTTASGTIADQHPSQAPSEEQIGHSAGSADLTDASTGQDGGEDSAAKDSEAEVAFGDVDETKTAPAGEDGNDIALESQEVTEASEGAAGDAAPADASAAAPALSADEALQRALLVALHETVADKDLPMLFPQLWAQHIKPAGEKLRGAPAEGIHAKQTSWKKFSVFMQAMAAEALLSVVEQQPGVEALAKVDRTHSLYLTYDPEAWLQADEEEDGVQFTATQRAATMASKFSVPKSGTQKVLVDLRRIRNRNVIVVHGLDRFGIHLDEDLRRDLSKAFSASVWVWRVVADQQKTMIGSYVSEPCLLCVWQVSYHPSVNKSEGTMIHIQVRLSLGRWVGGFLPVLAEPMACFSPIVNFFLVWGSAQGTAVTGVGEFIQERYKIAKRYMTVS